MSKPLCVNCISGHLIPGDPKGKQTKIANYMTYVATPKEGVTDPSKVIVSFSDIFGMTSPNNQIVADMLADQTGFTVYLPDLFDGKPLTLDHLSFPSTTKEAESLTFLTKVKDTFRFIMVLPWFLRHWPTRKDKDVLLFLNTVKASKGVEKVGAIGFCYGAKFGIDSNKTGLVDVTVACHPSFTNLDSYKNLRNPILFNCAETDDMFTDVLREQVKAYLDTDSSAPPHDFKVFENCVHGFCARPDLSDEKVKEGFSEANSRSASWFKQYL